MALYFRTERMAYPLCGTKQLKQHLCKKVNSIFADYI